MMSYDYPKLEAEALSKLNDIEGLTLKKILISIVEPEFNEFILYFENEAFSIAPRFGGEFVGIEKLDEHSYPFENREKVKEYSELEIFYNRKIVQVRKIGEAWNGHGIEIGFEGLFNKSLIIQSINAKPQPEDNWDCLRIGITNYFFEDSDFNKCSRN